MIWYKTKKDIVTEIDEMIRLVSVQIASDKSNSGSLSSSSYSGGDDSDVVVTSISSNFLSTD